jgi:hypothetical protein
VGGFINTHEGAHFAVKWEDMKAWKRTEQRPDITYMELLGVVLAAELYAKDWSGQAVKFWCDDYGACSVVARKAACFMRRDLNDLLARLCVLATRYRFYFWIEHIPGVKNVVADALSRGIATTGLKGQEHEQLAAQGTNALAQTEELYGTWTRNAEYILEKRDQARKDCRCDKTHKPTKDLCRKLAKDYRAREVKKKPNRKTRRAEKQTAYGREHGSAKKGRQRRGPEGHKGPREARRDRNRGGQKKRRNKSKKTASRGLRGAGNSKRPSPQHPEGL